MLSFLLIINMIFSACVNKDTVRLKKDKKINAKVLWQVRKYFPLRIIKREKKWSRVKDFRGDVYWVENEHLSTDYKCLMVKYKALNIRTGPGTKYGKKYKEPAKMFDCYRLLERKNGWVKVVDPYGDTGWMSEKGLWVY